LNDIIKEDSRGQRERFFLTPFVYIMKSGRTIPADFVMWELAVNDEDPFRIDPLK